jgi:type IV secretory pathway ATPase VirB11/archaellum biosynthesis ATPase
MDPCKYNISEVGHKKILFMDCSNCHHKGSFSAPICLSQTFNVLLESEGVEGIQYRKADFTEIYDSRDVKILFEIIEVIKELGREEIWAKIKDCERRNHKEWRAFIKKLIEGEFFRDPEKAYDMLTAIKKQYTASPEIKRRFKKECIESYLNILEEISSKLRDTTIIRNYLKGNSIRKIFKPQIKPSFVTSEITFKIPKNSSLFSLYKISDTDVRIFDLDGTEKIYFINPPELWLSSQDVELLTELKDLVIKKHTLEIISPLEARAHFKKIGSDLLREITAKKRIKLREEEIEKLSEIFSRYTAGYGLLEILFKDKKIYDIYIDSPAGATPIYLDHEDYGICNTNFHLSEDDLERISSKFRSIGGRPFDEANPIMDMELKDINIRVTGIREPSTFEGITYAFRKHRERPWTLVKFVSQEMFSARTAALLSFLISGQRSILITGARGSGKTSLLSALITEIKQSDRIVLMEDTPEISTKALRENGWKIEHLRNQPALSRTKEESYELSPEENLRAALRLGESVLILGEVRGPEARALFEAMRVGAAGNAVLGTIHGSTPYDTWDRITNDLRVPSTSFKAVDVVVSLGYKQEREAMKKSRHLRNITEVRKEWEKNPQLEGAFFDIMSYDDENEFERYNLESSEVIKEIGIRKGMSLEECKENIELREKMIRDIVDISNTQNLDDLLEVEAVMRTNKEYIKLMNEQTVKTVKGKIDYEKLYSNWKKWFLNYVEELKNNLLKG